jgi:O-antigen/teichoic acid export membrane protein
VLAATISDFMEGHQQFAQAALVRLVSGIVLTAASLVAVWLTPGPIALSFAYLLGPFLSLVLLVAILKRDYHHYPRVNIGVRHSMVLLWKSRYFTMQQFLNMVSINLTLLVLPKLVPPAAFGLFAAGTLLITRGVVLPDAIGTVFYPMIANAWDRERTLAIRRVWHGIALSIAVCVVASAIAFFLAGWISGILFPQDSTQCEAIIKITMWALPFLGVEALISYSLNAAGREAAQAKAAWWAAIASVPIAIVMMANWGIAGACWALIVRPVIKIGVLLPSLIKTVGYPGGEALRANLTLFENVEVGRT